MPSPTRAGGEWPDRARKAAVALVAESKRSTPSLGVRLLGDLHQVFGDRDAVGTGEIIEKLCRIDEAPWGDIRGKPIDARGLANRLRPYGIASKNVRLGEHVVKGYQKIDLWDAWQRYLGPPPTTSATCATSATSEPREPPEPREVALVADVADSMGSTHTDDAEVF